MFIQYISGKLAKGKTKFETSLKVEELERGVCMAQTVEQASRSQIDRSALLPNSYLNSCDRFMKRESAPVFLPRGSSLLCVGPSRRDRPDPLLVWHERAPRQDTLMSRGRTSRRSPPVIPRYRLSGRHPPLQHKLARGRIFRHHRILGRTLSQR